MVDYKDKFIGFDEELVPEVIEGTKFITYRIGGKFDFLETGDTISVRNGGSGEIFGLVEITDISRIPFAELPINIPGHEIYESKQHQKEAMEKYYGDRVKDDVIVTVIAFKLINQND